MLTTAQRNAFERLGHVRLPGAFDRASVDAVADRVWQYLGEHRGVRRDDPRTWSIDAPWVGLKALKDEAPYRALSSPAVERAIDALLGAGTWRAPRNWGGFLVTFPDCRPDAWQIARSGWHVDAHYTHDPDSLFGVRVFTFLSEVGPRGGGTLLVSGSHRLVRRFVAAKTAAERRAGYSALREQFNASHPFFAELSGASAHSGESGAGAADRSRRGRLSGWEHEIDGVPVRVDELCGAPGDVVLADPWILHARSPNAGPGPRLMLGKDVHRAAPYS